MNQMSKLLVLVGLPASGKSTFARELVAKGWKRVNKDDLRSMIDDSKWSRDNEKKIIAYEDALVIMSLNKGWDVVVDDTNFGHQERWKHIAGTHNAEFEVKFFDVPLMECIERDSKRGDKSVGSKVIMRMYEQYLKPAKPSILRDKPSAYIFDIDGTLALMQNRSPFDWLSVGEDKCNEDVARLLRILNNTNNKIIICSGRDEVCRDETKQWLEKHSLKYDELFMRKQGDSRKDCIVKKELYEENIKGKYNVLGVFDDRNQVVDLWRSLGLTCMQVYYGDF